MCPSACARVLLCVCVVVRYVHVFVCAPGCARLCTRGRVRLRTRGRVCALERPCGLRGSVRVCACVRVCARARVCVLAWLGGVPLGQLAKAQETKRLYPPLQKSND